MRSKLGDEAVSGLTVNVFSCFPVLVSILKLLIPNEILKSFALVLTVGSFDGVNYFVFLVDRELALEAGAGLRTVDGSVAYAGLGVYLAGNGDPLVVFFIGGRMCVSRSYVHRPFVSIVVGAESFGNVKIIGMDADNALPPGPGNFADFAGPGLELCSFIELNVNSFAFKLIGSVVVVQKTARGCIAGLTRGGIAALLVVFGLLVRIVVCGVLAVVGLLVVFALLGLVVCGFLVVVGRTRSSCSS